MMSAIGLSSDIRLVSRWLCAHYCQLGFVGADIYARVAFEDTTQLGLHDEASCDDEPTYPYSSVLTFTISRLNGARTSE